MKMKKFISIAAAAVIGFTVTAFSVGAEAEEETDTAAPAASSTICFDTDMVLEHINTFGSVEETGLAYRITSERAASNGSLVISENFMGESDSQSTGIYFNCADFGLETLAGCTISLKVYALSSGADELMFYSDGDVFLSESIAMTANPYWETVTLSIPETINNQMFGMLITASGSVNGEICNIDELCLYKPNGEMAENIGDFQVIEEGGGTSGVNRVLMIVVFVLLIIAVVGCCAYFLLKFVVWRYR